MNRTSQAITMTLLTVVILVHPATAQVTILSDFNDDIPDWDMAYPDVVAPTAIETNGQLTLRAQFTPTNGKLVNSLTGVKWSRNHTIRHGETLEYRVELIRMSPSNVLAGLGFHATDILGEGSYWFFKDADNIVLTKVSSDGEVCAAFLHEPAPMWHPRRNPFIHRYVTLSVTFTRVGDSVSITCSIFAPDGSVLFEKSALDSPGIDPTVSPYPGLPGAPDPGPPYGLVGSSGPFLYLAQVTDGDDSEVEVAYDNFACQYRDITSNSLPTLRITWVTEETFLPDSAATNCGPGPGEGLNCESSRDFPASPNVGDKFEILLLSRGELYHPIHGIYKYLHNRIREFWCYGNDGQWHIAGAYIEHNVAETLVWDPEQQLMVTIPPNIEDIRFTPEECMPAEGHLPSMPRALRLSWPVTLKPFAVEEASTMNGPWRTMDYPTTETNGVNSITVPRPNDERMQIFRLREIPR